MCQRPVRHRSGWQEAFLLPTFNLSYYNLSLDYIGEWRREDKL